MYDKKSVNEAYLDAKKSRDLYVEQNKLMVGCPPAEKNLVTHRNYMVAPNNRWGFKRLEQLTRSITVGRGDVPVRPLISAPQDLSGVLFKSKCGREVSVQEHLKSTYTDGFIVLKDAKSVYECYFDGYQPNDRHIMFSVTKSLVGLIAEDLITKDIIDENLLVIKYIPELIGSAFGDATVRQVLNMTVGIDCYEEYDDPTGITAQFGYASGLWQQPEGSDYPDNICDYLKKLRKHGSHGMRFEYVTACTEVVAWIVERAAGQSISKLVEVVWSQLGCERDAYFVNDAHGRACSGGGFNATLRDMARFAIMVSQRGEWEGRQLFSPSAVDRLFEGGDPEHYALNESYSSWTPGASYKSHWYVYSGQSIMAVGIHGQIVYIHRPSGVVIVKQSSSPTAESPLYSDTVVMLKVLAENLS
ncbi:serine hydrolase [Pseudomonas poae]|nr:serine hydrolase [Pseudomonas poae]